jgi:hypothetical protein
MAMLKDEYNNIQQEINDTMDQLKAADAYGHLYIRALDDVPAEDHLPRWIIRPGLELLMDPSVTDPRQHKEACKWC